MPGAQPVQATIELFDAFTAPMMQIINAANLGANAISAMQNVVNANIDPSAMQQMEQSIQDAQAAAERFREALRGMEIPENTAPAVPEPVQVPFQWQSGDNVEVFNASGTERWRQEIADVTSRMQRLSDTQNQITQNAANSNVFSPTAVSDITAVNQRISAIQARIARINSNRANAVNPNAAAEAESLRRQLASMLQTQQQLNSAVDDMDIEAANQAYLRLSDSANNVERYIRDNVDEQGRFNQAVNQGASNTDKLTGYIKKAAGAFISIQGIQKIVEVSDEMSSITARLDNMNQGFNKVNKTAIGTDSVVKSVYQAAEDARGSFSDMSAVVAKFGNNAKDAFSSQQEVIGFVTLVQKQMINAGASTAEASNAMLQLSQAMGSVVLRGDELNSIFEQAPNLIQNIADYLDKPMGKIREMAANGEISAAVVKAAVFQHAGEINDKFNNMPKTWGQVWQSMKNQAVMAMQPVLDKISEMAKAEEVQEGISAIMDILATAAEVAVEILGVVAEAAAFVVDNWEVLAPIFLAAATALGVYNLALAVHTARVKVATLAQQGFNFALAAKSALTAAAGVLVFVGAIGLYTKGVNDAYGTTFSFAGMLGGAFMTVFATLGNMVYMIWDIVATCVVFIWNIIADLANFFGNVFKNPVRAIIQLFTGLFDSILSVIEGIAGAIGELFGEDWTSGFEEFRSTMKDAVNDTYGENEEFVKKLDPDAFSIKNTFGVDYADYEDAFEAGYYFGDTMFGGDGSMNSQNNSNNNKNDEMTELLSKVDELNQNTDSINETLTVSEEDLKYLRDIAEQEAVNRFTTAEITIEQTNHNTISGGMDLDGIVDGLTEAVGEAASIISEGAYA